MRRTPEREERVWIKSGHRKDRIGQSGIVKHLDLRDQDYGKVLVWVKFEDRGQAICFNKVHLAPSPLEWLAEQAD
jgi:hypothetical protein